MLSTTNRRRHTPSYSIPFIFESLEVLMIWIVFSIFEGTFKIADWSLVSSIFAFVWLLYTFYKLARVLDRQKH